MIRQFNGSLAENDEAALLEIGDGVLLFEFRGKMNAIGDGVLRLLETAEDMVRASDLAGLVIGNTDPRVFTAGADLVPVARQAAAGEWAKLDEGVRAFQRASTRLRTLPFPVVVAPFGLDARRRRGVRAARRRRCRRTPSCTSGSWKSVSGSFQPAAEPRSCCSVSRRS